jgi:hypothetical protein
MVASSVKQALELLPEMTMVWSCPGVIWQFGPALATAIGHALAEFTVTWKVQEFALPVPSVARQVTVVTPGGNVLPDGGVQTKLAMPHGSEAPAL